MKINWKPKNEIERAGIKAVKLLRAQNFQAFWVGGIVRNILLKRVSDNIDIATDAAPDQTESVLKKAGIENKSVGKKFGTILAIIDHQLIEITTFRSESEYSDKRHPDQVEFIKEYLDDAKRRDFTVNALYFNPITKELFDPTSGMKDLRSKSLRFVDEPKKRINEDALRMLRGVRLATQLGFKLEKKSLLAIKTQAKHIQDISGERVKAELDKILLSENRAQGLELLDESGLLSYIIHEFEKLKSVYHHSKTFHLEGSVRNHIFRAVEILAINDLALTYAALFHDIGKVMKPQKVYKQDGWRYSFKGHIELSGVIFNKFAAKFKFPKEQRDLISFLIENHDNRRWFMELRAGKQIEFLLKQSMPELLVELWRVDSGANKRIQDGKVVWGTSDSVPHAKSVLSKIKKAKPKFYLASGDLIMKYSKLKSGPHLGEKILEIKIQIVLGKIKSESDLKNFLKSS